MVSNPEDVAPVRDGRLPPFSYQTTAALAALRAHFPPKRRSTALAVYVSLTEAANRAGGVAAREGFQAARGEIAAEAGVSADTLDRYARELVTAGLLLVERVKIGAINLPNRWVLIEPDSGLGAPPSRTGAATPSRTGAAPRARSLSELQERKQEEPPAVGSRTPPPLHKIDGRNLAWDTLAAACQIRPDDPNRAGELAASLNGGRNVRVGIRALAWHELIESRDDDADDLYAAAVAEPHRFERALVALIERRVSLYRSAMPGAGLTPTALAKWWLSLEDAPRRGGLTAEEMEQRG